MGEAARLVGLGVDMTASLNVRDKDVGDAGRGGDAGDEGEVQWLVAYVLYLL